MPTASELKKRAEQPPRFREAYPQFNIVPALAAMRRGYTTCEFTDRWGEPKGVARLALGNDCCQLEYDLRNAPARSGRGWKTFDLTSTRNGYVKDRALLFCPRCETRTKTLVFRDTWACASCHDLLFRSQLIHPLSKQWEKVDELSSKVKNGKPHGMHNKTYEELLTKLQQLELKLYGKPRRYASDKYSHVLSCTWRAPVLRDSFSFPAAPPAITPSAPGLLGPVFPPSESKLEFCGGYEAAEPEDL